MKFRAKLQSMSENEIKSMIQPYYLEDIKRKDPKPLFKSFIIGQEGEAEANWIGVGKIVKTWFSDAVGKLARNIYSGLKIFLGHAQTNEHEGRKQIGEVAGSRTKIIDDKFSAIIAAYIYPEFKNLPLDVASIEADVNIDNDISGEIHAVNVGEITGIALGNSAVERPGFPGATLLGELQAFAERSKLSDEPEWQFGYKITGQEERKFKLAEEA